MSVASQYDLSTVFDVYQEIGWDKVLETLPQNRFVPNQIISEKPVIAPAITAVSSSQAVQNAREIAGNCQNLEDLRRAITGFDDLTIRKTATNMVFGDGVGQNPVVMVLGDVPDADDDIKAMPFSGASGELLDKMLGAIGLSRKENAYLSHFINWRPPGNRSPSQTEIDVCFAFVQAHIRLVQPKYMILMGNISTKYLLNKDEAFLKLRGKFCDINNDALGCSIPAIPIYHPAQLIKTPALKKQAWADLQLLQETIGK